MCTALCSLAPVRESSRVMFACQTEEEEGEKKEHWAARGVSGSGFKSSFVLSRAASETMWIMREEFGSNTHRHTRTHTHIQEKHLGPAQGEPDRPAVSASVSLGQDAPHTDTIHKRHD